MPAIGPTVLVLVAGRELDLARGRELLGLFRRVGAALVDEPAHDGAAHRPAHPVPRDGRPGVQE